MRTGSARSTLLTVLGELVWSSRRPAWTWSLVYVMKGLGIEEQSSRQSIARAAASGWIEAERCGREVRWHLTDSGRGVFQRGSQRVTSMTGRFGNWDGRWLVLFVTIPQSQRSKRKKLYAGLTWAGFGNPTPGVWVSPHPERSGEVTALIQELGFTEQALSFVGHVADVGLDERSIVTEGWQLESIAQRYTEILDELEHADPSPDDEMLCLHIRMISEWQRFPFSDPQLPEALLPDWIGRDVIQKIEDKRAQWLVPVRDRWAEINADRVDHGASG